MHARPETAQSQKEAASLMTYTLKEKGDRFKIDELTRGEAPSNHPEFAAFLLEGDIDSISVAADSVLSGYRTEEEAEERRE